MIAPVEADTRHNTMDSVDPYAVEIEGLSVRNGQVVAVRNLFIHVPRGAIYGLMGPSGSGKTTIMRTLATLQPPETGTIRVDGIDIGVDPAAVRERIGYLPDFSGVYEQLTVAEYLDFYGAIYRISPHRRRQSTSDLLELVGLTDQHGSPVKSLSRGMKQQLGLARCLMHDPTVLLLDEPAAGMDPQSRLDLRDILQELARFGTTILITSHLLSDLAEVCTHLGFVRSGELVIEGQFDEILSATSPESRLRVQLLNMRDRETVRQLLETREDCRQVDVLGDTALTAWFAGADADLAVILQQLVAQGVQVAKFGLEPQSLEEIFLRITASSTEE